MFIGHFAVGFASKKFAPRASLAVLLAAPLFSDMLWPVFLLLGWEHVRIAPGDTRYTPLDLYDYPWSHSLLMTVVWAAAFAAIYRLWKGDSAGTVVVFLGVASHWILDWITHRPDMPLYPGGRAHYGLGLWNSVAGTMIVELAVFGIGVWLYARSTKPRDRIGRYAFWAYVVLLLVLYIGDRFASPPDSAGEIAWTGIIAMVLLLPWAWWFDHHRDALAVRE
jgi:membrane-bound metal-dependent hydrolase YbcI (DUF457 family)